MTGIFFGSTTGTTEALAEQIAGKLGVAGSDVHNVSDASADQAAGYDTLLLGSSTWGLGELQDDWYDFLDSLKTKNLSGKKVALFGTGDAESYPDTFCDAMGIIKEELAATGCTFVGAFDQAGYPYTDSKAFEGGKVIGLAADETNEPDKTEERLNAWVSAL